MIYHRHPDEMSADVVRAGKRTTKLSANAPSSSDTSRDSRLSYSPLSIVLVPESLNQQ